MKTLQKMYWTFKNHHSHLILITHQQYGCKSFAKMVGILMNITTNDIKNMSVSTLLEDVVKVLKTGGKIEEVINIIG